MKIDLKILDGRIGTEFSLPSYAKEGDAAVDLRAMIDKPIEIFPGDFKIIPTGIALGMKNPEVMVMIVPRSGLGTQGLVLKNTIGIIDSGYTGELKLTPFNNNKPKYKYSWRNKRIFENKNANQDNTITINPGDRIAQMIFVPIIRVKFNIVDSLLETERGNTGFGDSGVNKLVNEPVYTQNDEDSVDWNQVSDDVYDEVIDTSEDFREDMEGVKSE